MIPDDDLNELDLIERYLRDQLSDSERHQLTSRLQQDTTFAMKVESTRQLMKLIQTANIEQRAADTLKKLYQQQAIGKRRAPFYYWIGYSALAACISSLLYLAFATIQLPTVQDDLLIVRNRSAPADTIGSARSPYNRLLEGQRALNRKNYLQAATDLEVVVRTDSMRPYYREASEWLLTVAYLQSDQPHRAEDHYKALQKIDHPEYTVSLLEQWKIYLQIQLRKWQ